MGTERTSILQLFCLMTFVFAPGGTSVCKPPLRRDNCGVCGGNDNTCKEVSGVKRDQNLTKGYHEIVQIPKGSTAIRIRELESSQNDIVFRSRSGSLTVSRKTKSQSKFAGTSFKQHNTSGLPNTLFISAAGPTNETVAVYLLLQGKLNPGVQYSFCEPVTSDVVDNVVVPQEQILLGGQGSNLIEDVSTVQNVLPNRIEDVQSSEEDKEGRYTWNIGVWTQCSSDCGEGIQRRAVSCMDREMARVVDSSQCGQEEEPVSYRRCRGKICSKQPSELSVQWHAGSWGRCSSTCDTGDQVKDVYCAAIETGREPYKVDDFLCEKQYGARPQYRRSCNDDIPCPTWTVGRWSQCSASCDQGIQYRDVMCRGNKGNTMKDGACSETDKPIISRRCIGRACDNIDTITNVNNRNKEVKPKPAACVNSLFGCCPDGITPAQGLNGLGCQSVCLSYKYGCCPDGKTPASGVDNLGCAGCTRSVYGCCPDGRTSRRDRQGSGCLREPSITNTNVCSLDPERGTCVEYNYQVRWFYNYTKQRCDRFWWGGCESGNGNRFDTEQQCQSTCQSGGSGSTGREETPVCGIHGCCRDGVTPAKGPGYYGCPSPRVSPSGPVCKMPELTGGCRNFTVRWLYDADQARCRRFWYGGCDGNENNFATQKDCEARCIGGGGGKEDTEERRPGPDPVRTVKPGSCPAVTGSGICIEGCQDDSSCPGDQKCCSNGCGRTCQDPRGTGTGSVVVPRHDGSGCGQPKERGRCSNYTVMWYYDRTKGKCDRFWYGGCDGNGNRFPSEAECASKCSTPITVEDICKLPSVTGPCRAALPRFYFDASSGECQNFLYGGCRGNDNRFMTRSECEKKCKRTMAGDKIHNLRSMMSTNDRIMIEWEKPQRNQVQNYRLEYMGVKYVGDQAKQEPMKEVILSGSLSSYTMDNLMDNAEYTINLMPVFENGGSGPKSSLVTKTKSRDIPLLCGSSEHGCCPDGVTKAAGPNFKGCQDACQGSEFGCCEDGETPATGLNNEGCEYVGSGDDDNFCEQTVYKCCPDGVTPAQGPNNEGCGLVETTRTCRDSRYGCCPDGKTEASGPSNMGCPSTGMDICSLKNDRGNCQTFKVYWFYNTTASRCDRFWYGGCDGNANRFENETLCNQACGGTRRPDTLPKCQQPARQGPCKAYLRRYYFNTDKQACDVFDYGGCQGNANNFETLDQCKEECDKDIDIDETGDNVDVYSCSHAKEAGPCGSWQVRWYFDRDERRCKQFYYGGCEGNSNNFQMLEQCEDRCSAYIDPKYLSKAKQKEIDRRRDVCQQLMDTGPCRGNFPRWYYDEQRGDCFEFVYGGCDGNENNFPDKGACLRKCMPDGVKPLDKEEEDICTMSSDTGPCRADIQRWFYDHNDGVCKTFTYGGCDGNKNNFERREDCEKACNRTYVCRNFVIPPIQCLAYIERFTYNPRNGECEKFIYGGCGGNSNNFGSMSACQRKCTPGSVRVPTTARPEISLTWREVCNLPAETGVCRAYIQRYYFDAVSGSCQQFTYGGCQGNQNNFENLEICQKYCDPGSISVDPTEGSGDPETEVPTVPPTTGGYCTMPKDAGNCLAYIPAWYYDHDTGTCKEFVYGGCGGNDNRFTSQEICEASCNRDMVCQMPKATGQCRAYVLRAYYNTQDGECQLFYYGGCEGNANNFASVEACSAKCGGRVTPRITPAPTRAPVTAGPRPSDSQCDYPLEKGNGNGMTVMYYYDKTISDCRPFRYSGAGGNPNRFDTGTECREACWAGYNRIRTVTPAPPRTTPRPVYTLPPPVNTPRPSVDVADVCLQNSERGPCSNYTVMWYYDSGRSRCKRFWYGGCEGNSNRFANEKDCENACVNKILPPITPAPTPRPPDTNRCGSRFGCCPDGRTPATDRYFSNCNVDPGTDNTNEALTEGDYTTIMEQPGRDILLVCRIFSSAGENGVVSWYKDSFAIANDNRFTVLVNGSLLIRSSRVDDSGFYACRVSTSSGSQGYIERYRLRIQVPIGIFPTPPKIEVKPNGNAFLHCQAYGNPRPTVTWTKNGRPLPNDRRYVVYPNGTLIIFNSKQEDMGDYLCVASNGVSSPAQRVVKLSMRESLRAVIDPIQGRLRVGERLYLHCSAYGYPTPSIQWEVMGRPISSNQRVSVIRGDLRITNLTLDDTGLYKCIVSNDEEKVEASVSVQVIPRDVAPPDCRDRYPMVKCRLIVRARLCGYTIYSTPCCNSCEKERKRLMRLGRRKK